VALAACTSAKPVRVVTVTRTPSPTRAASSAPASTSPAASPGATATRQTALPGTCDTLLPDLSVKNAIDINTFTGTDAFVVGQPEPDIGRLAYLNCRYGVTGKAAAATPAVEIGISLYRTPAQAAARIAATVDDYTAHGATATDVTVQGKQASMLTGGVGTGYDVPTVVVSSGQRTVAVSIASTVASGAKARTDATALASLALQRTGG
jgi:hypothetical protein